MTRRQQSYEGRVVGALPPGTDASRRVWTKWVTVDAGFGLAPARLVGMIRFDREDGRDPRVEPEVDGTHLLRGRPGGPHDDGSMEASCGKRGRGFADYGPITGITCPGCAAELVAQMLCEQAGE